MNIRNKSPLRLSSLTRSRESDCGGCVRCAEPCVVSDAPDTDGGLTGLRECGSECLPTSPSGCKGQMCVRRGRMLGWENRTGGGGATKADGRTGRDNSSIEGNLWDDDFWSRTKASETCLTFFQSDSRRELGSRSNDRSTTPEAAAGRVPTLRRTDVGGEVLARRSKSEGRAVRTLPVLAGDPSLEGGRGGSGRHPSGSETKEMGRDDDSAMDVGRDEAGGVGGRVWNEERLVVLSLIRLSSKRRSPLREGRASAARPTTVADEALVVAVVAEAWEWELGELGELTVISAGPSLGDMVGDLWGVSSKTEKRRRAPGQERP